MKLKILSWNVNGLNDFNKRDIIKSLVRKWKVDILCLQETKLQEWNAVLIHHIWGNRWAAWVELKASGTRGGVIVLWDKRRWKCVDSQGGSYSLSHVCWRVCRKNSDGVSRGVYGPHTNPERREMWHELAAIKGLWSEQWVIGGDFNTCIYESERLNCTRRSRAM